MTNNDDQLMQLKSCDLFQGLSEEDLLNLSSRMEQTKLSPGDVLMTEGEDSDCMYVLLSGRLMVKNHLGETIGQVGRGQTVGEMGLVTDAPRSATVIAIRSSVLLKLEKERFDTLWRSHPDILYEIAKITTKRLQRTIKSVEGYSNNSNIVVVGANSTVDVGGFFEKLQDNFDDKFRYKILKRTNLDEDMTTAHMLSHITKLESQYDYIFYDVSGADQQWQEVCLEFADRILVLAPGGQEVEFDQPVIGMLSKDEEFQEIRKGLVLLYDRDVVPKNTDAWLSRMNFFRHHHVCPDKKQDMQRLLRFINGSAIGLALGGGGARVWAQIGAMKYFFDNKIPFDALAGTSAGSLNAAVISICRDFQDYVEISKAIADATNFHEYTIPVASLLSSKSITSILKEIFGERKLEDLSKTVYCVAADIAQAREERIDRGLIWQAVRSSIAIPGVYAPVNVDGKVLVDGAVMNNLPVDVLRDHMEGLGKVIAIDISAVNQGYAEYNYPLELTWSSVLTKIIFNASEQFRAPKINDTFLQALLSASEQKANANRQLADICLKPDIANFPMLDTSHMDKLQELGLEEAKRKLANWQEVLLQGKT